MWPFRSNDLFPPPTEAWLQKVSSDPEAQGWGAWGMAEKTPLGPRAERKAESDEEAEENGDAGFLLSMLKQENLAESPVYNQELEAIKLKLWAMEHADTRQEPSYVQRRVTEEEGAEARQLLSPETIGYFFPGTPKEKVEADHRSVYVGNVDYGGSAAELEAYFSPCGEIHRVTILCDKFSGHPKGYAYIEFASQSSVQAAVDLDESTFRGRIIKIVVGCGHTWAAGLSPSYTVASIEDLGSDPMDKAGAVDASHHGSHHIEKMAQFSKWGQELGQE